MCPPIAAFYILFSANDKYTLLVSKTVSKINLKNLKTRSLDSENYFSSLDLWTFRRYFNLAEEGSL